MEAAMGASLLTILTATVASWIFGAVWYGALAKPWMAATGLSEADIKQGSGVSNALPFIISFIAEFVMAYMLAVLLLHTSTDGFSLGSAVLAAFLIWLAFIFTTLTVNHRYGMRPWSLTFIDGFHWLGVLVIQALVMVLMGL